MSSLRERNEMLWRLLRMQAAPYYVLGTRHDHTPVRYKIDTPWDFQQRYSLVDFEITAGQRGQPSVNWSAVVRTVETADTIEVAGHVEVRWSHGKLNGSPEAKVYLDCEPESVPGYQPL